MIVAFHSKGQRAGKDTAADFASEWCQEHDSSYERFAFGDKMKLLCALALGEAPVNVDNDPSGVVTDIDRFKLTGRVEWTLDGNQLEPRVSITGRDFIINLAEGARRLFGASFWTDQCLPYGWTPSADYTFITDLRFVEEANRVAELGGVVVEIVNPNAVNVGGRSEEGLDPLYIDLQLHTDGNLDTFHTTIWGLMDNLSRATSRA